MTSSFYPSRRPAVVSFTDHANLDKEVRHG